MSYGRQKSAKRRALEHAQTILGWTGIGSWYARSRKLEGATILLYHSVADQPQDQWIDPDNRLSPREFRLQVQFLARYRNVISLAKLIDNLQAGDPVARGTVVLTFDDGYLDNLEVAFPILDAYKLPATLYLPTKYIDDGQNHWIDRLHSLFKLRTSDALEVAIQNANDRFGGSYVLRDQSSCRHAYSEISTFLLGASYEQREETLTSIAEQLKPSGNMPNLTMSWDDIIRTLERHPDIEIGSHSETHLDLSAYPDEMVQTELQNSKRRIEMMTGKEVHTFSFPYNRVSMSAMQMLNSLGYQAAVASADTMVRAEDRTQAYQLPRLDPGSSLGRLAFITSGGYPELSKKLFGRY